jgi:hypothetical protein
MSTFFCALIFVGLAATQVRNPVMPGDHPDSGVVRFGGEFWTSNTSSE